MKTNAMRILDTLDIPYGIREYDVDPDDLSAEHVARDIGMPPEQVFKTLVARGDRHGVLLAVVPADAELDFKALARLSDNKTVELVSLKEVQPLTDYIRGGVTALAGKRDFYPTNLHIATLSTYRPGPNLMSLGRSPSSTKPSFL